MNKILDKLTPGFLKRLDVYLLENHPAIWRTQGHLIIPITLATSCLLFLGGYFLYPISVHNLVISPIKEIKIQEEILFLIPFWLLLLGSIYWSFQQFQIKHQYTNLSSSFYSFLIYFVCLFLLFGIVPPSFLIGTFYSTANEGVLTKSQFDD